MKKFTKLVLTTASIVTLSTALTACWRAPDTNLRENDVIGYYRGYEVSFLKDKAMNSSKGLYFFKKTGQNPNDDGDFSETLSGYYDNKELYFVKDRNFDSKGKGFYVIKEGDNFIPVATYAQNYSAGKGVATKAVGAMKEYDLNSMTLQELEQIQMNLESELNKVNQAVNKIRR